jgi:hypothetical protein
VVSEAGLERLSQKLEMEFIWEDSDAAESKRNMVVAGSMVELVVKFTDDIVQSVSFSFPMSGESLNRHAPQAGAILLDDLKLAESQSPLTKRLDRFAANFQRLATLDKLSAKNPGLNLFQAVAGVHVSLDRLHQWEMQRMRLDPALVGKSDEYLRDLALCSKSGIPVMNGGGRVGLSLDYWKQSRLFTSPNTGKADERTWSILIGCGPMSPETIAVNPVRNSEHWISADIEKIDIPGNLQPEPLLDWQQPENNFVQDKASDDLSADPSLLVPRLPDVVFTATFDPPLHVPYHFWEQMRHLGCVSTSPAVDYPLKIFDQLVLPLKPGTSHDPRETRLITRTQPVPVVLPGATAVTKRVHRNRLYVYKAFYGTTLSEVAFSHPQQLISVLPYLRQYAFLSTLLDNSFGENPDSPQASLGSDASSATRTTTTTRDGYETFMGESNGDIPEPEGPVDCEVDVTMSIHPTPALQVTFPFRDSMANVSLELRENGQVHVESQNVLDETNSVAPNGRQRRPEDVGKVLENFEHIGKWCEFIRTRWA